MEPANHAPGQRGDKQNRREFLKKTTTAAAGLILAADLLAAKDRCGSQGADSSAEAHLEPQNQTIMHNTVTQGPARVITIEEHFIIREIAAQVNEFNQRQGNISPQAAAVQKELMAIVLPLSDDIQDTAQRRIQFMDEAGIDMQVLSYGANSPQNISDAELAVKLCRETNSHLAAVISANPSRFSGFAVLPCADPLQAAAELERAVAELGLKGAMLSGTFQGRFFDDPYFFPIFEKAAALGVPIYMHPAIIDPKIAGYYYQSSEWSPVAAAMFATAGYGWHVDSGIAVIRLIASGIFDKLPALELISGHWGELVPFYLNRLDDQLGKTLTLKRKISDYYKSNVYITPAGLFSEAQLQYAIAEIGADRILYSGDYPFLIDKNTRGFIANARISLEDKSKIAHLNAERLLKLF